jgi:hypothetical protein
MSDAILLGLLRAWQGYYCPGSGFNYPCKAGNFCPSGTATGITCPQGKFCPAQAAIGTGCGTGDGTGHFSKATGLTAVTECDCAESWTGSNCDQFECPPVLDFISLGLLLIEASYPEELRETGSMDERALSQWTTAFYINSILRTADANGDDELSRAEALLALQYAYMDIPSQVLSTGVVWASPTVDEASKMYIPSDYANWELSESAVTGYTSATVSCGEDCTKTTYNDTYSNAANIVMMTKEAVKQFVETGTFYGYPGASTTTTSVVDMHATYPDSTWTEATCNAKLNSGVTLSWSYKTETASLYQQCGYVNGGKIAETKYNDRMVAGSDCTTNVVTASGAAAGSVPGTYKNCSFADPDDIATRNRKRFYCVYSTFCPTATCNQATLDSGLTRLMCQAGLLYDGKPADVFPTFSIREGVKWRWLDTATSELGFRIFRDTPIQEAGIVGQLIADIPFTSPRCGQQFAPIQYVKHNL